MTEAIEYEQLEQAEHNGHGSSLEADLNRLSDIPMELSVEIGRTHMTVGETLDLRVGSVVALERLAGETADLLVNGSAIARGEVVVIDEQYGLRLTEILDSEGEAAQETMPVPLEQTKDAELPVASSPQGEGEEAKKDEDGEATSPAQGDEA